jgi:protein O-mannosyl-transferase
MRLAVRSDFPVLRFRCAWRGNQVSKAVCRQSSASETPAKNLRRVIWIGVLVTAAILSYSNTFDVPFIFDDKIRIEENSSIRQLWPASVPMTESNRPFGLYTIAVNYALHGYEVWGYHATNLSIHILAGLALFGIVRRTLLGGALAKRYQTSATPLAFTVALLWLVHPLNTQAVTYIIQRLESLMGLCYLLTLYCFIRAHDSPQRVSWWYCVSVLCCALGMGVKEVMVTAPVMVLWYHRAFLAKSWKDLFRGPARYYYPALFGTWGVLAWAMLRSHAEYEMGNIGAVKGITPLEYLLSQAGVITHYLKLSIWPYGQCLDYGWPVSRTAREIVPPLFFIGFLFAATVWAIFRHPRWGFLGGWFFVILGPTSSVVPIIDLAFEQRMYLPLIAVIALYVFAADGVLSYFANHRHFSEKRLRWIATGVVTLLALQMSVLTWARNEVYRNEISIWEDAIEKAPKNARAHTNLGMILHSHGEANRALDHCKNAVDLAPDNADINTNLGVLLLETGQREAAIALHKKAIKIDRYNRKATTNLGVALWEQGHYAEALGYFRRAVDLNPSNAEAHRNLAKALSHEGQTDEALAYFSCALKSRPNDFRILFDIAVTLEQAGRTEDAIRYYKKVISLAPNFSQAQHNLAVTLMARENLSEAVQHFRAAIAIDPRLAVSYFGMGEALFQLGYVEEAIKNYEKALQIEPSLSQAVKRIEALQGRQDRDELGPK